MRTLKRIGKCLTISAEKLIIFLTLEAFLLHSLGSVLGLIFRNEYMINNYFKEHWLKNLKLTLYLVDSS